MNRTRLSVLAAAILIPACDGGSSTPADTASTSGGETGTGDGSPEPTSGSPGTMPAADDPDAADDADPTDDTDAADASESETETDDGVDTGPSDVDPARLPFGGYVYWLMQYWDGGPFAVVEADFYEVEYPDVPDAGPTEVEAPLGAPISEDDWQYVAGVDDPGQDPKVESTITDLNLSPQLFVDSDSVSLTAEYDAGAGNWFVFDTSIGGKAAGGEWTVQVPENREFPELNATLEYTPTYEETGIEVVRDGDGIPTGAIWTPNDAQRVELFIVIESLTSGEILCRASLVDDGEVEFPPGCVGLGRLDLDPEYEGVGIILGQVFEKDVAFDDHRIRLTSETAMQENFVYPYEPPR